MNYKNKITSSDIFVLVAVILICLVWYVFSKSTDGTTAAQIYYNGKIVETIVLDTAQDRQIKVDATVIEIQSGKIRFCQSDCPDSLCVKSGWLQNNGDTAACVPNKTVIVIKKEKGKTAHAVTY